MESIVALKTAAEQKSQPLYDQGTEAPLSLETDWGHSAGIPLFLQRSAANSKERSIQTKLTVSDPQDSYEQEADRLAGQVMSKDPAEIQTQPLVEKITPFVQRRSRLDNKTKCETCEPEETVQRVSNNGVSLNQPNLESRLNAAQGGGSTLSHDVRSYMEPRFGTDFSRVRVHTNNDAVQMNHSLNAQAFTHGHDIYYGDGKAPGNNALTAHELTHVVQQTNHGAENEIVHTNLLQRTPNSQTVAALTASLPVMKANARLLNSAYVLASSYINLAIADTDLISTKLQIFSINYDIAYSNYSTVITQARAEAQNQTLWRGILLGIGTGVLAGIAAAYIAPSTAAGWFALTLADVGTAAGSSCLQAIASSAIALAVSDAMTVRGSNLQPGGLSPDLLDSHIWKHVALMYRGTSELNSVLDNFHRNSILFEHLIAEMRVAIAGGDSPYSAEDILASVPILCGQMANMTTVTTALIQKATELISFTNSIISYDPNQPNITQMERDIWIMWMGTLSNDDSDILDLDNVEDHLLSIGILGSGGLLGVDFGSYTSEDDELAALAAARPQATTIQGRYDIAASQWIPPSP